DTVPVILAAKDKPDWVHHALSVILSKRLEAIEKSGNIPVDIIECGGGAGSNTVISPDMHEEFCLPYDQKQHAAIHEKGPQIVYHLCGGVMQTLDLVAQNGADGLETMTPPGMGGDCDLEKATKQVGDKLFFIGGFDQSAGFENGSPEAARDLVLDCHEACPDGGYICAPSDHFFHGDPESVQAFSDAAKDCHYN
ncbi:MAG: uroporphyrinogen decarboxylase family protein, partial [Candidatus Marinimicrobia bacterium]|nr:uroporphyrinogen decarboxylase family protein [Candidatus Neomarinimicrobiota bacterium]